MRIIEKNAALVRTLTPAEEELLGGFALGTLVGAVILGVLQNGLVMLSVPYYAMDIIKGLVLALALAITYIQRR